MGWAADVSSGRTGDTASASPDHRRVPDRRSWCGPWASPGDDESDVACRGSHEGSKRVRPAWEIEDDEVGPGPNTNPGWSVPIGHTTSAQRHLENLARRHPALHPGDAKREFHLSRKGRRVDHPVVRSRTRPTAV